MTSTPIGSTSHPRVESAPTRAGRPRPIAVSIATTILHVLAVLGLIQALIVLVGGVMVTAEGGLDGLPPGLMFAGIGTAVALYSFYVLLAVKTRRGHRWAWILSLLMLSLVALLGVWTLYYGITTDGSLAGLVFLVPSALLILLLAGPRSSREYFRRR
jgi:hypothetical protein